MAEIIIGITIIIIIGLLLSKQKQKKRTVAKENWDIKQYYLQRSILTEREMKFYRILEKTIPKGYIIAPKVGLKEFVGIKKGPDYMKQFGHISQKHIDFLICNEEELKPILAIELDDKTHSQENRIKRDQEINEIYNQIGIKIIHVKTNQNQEAIQKEIKNFFIPEEAERPEGNGPH